jgi:hypothetical protein
LQFIEIDYDKCLVKTAQANIYSPGTSFLKSRIPWLSQRSNPKEDEKSNMTVLQVLNSTEERTRGSLLQYGLFNNLQDLFPYYLPKR